MSEQRNYHTVKKGDTLWKIAKDNGTTAEALKKINRIQSAHNIHVGQRIALRKEAVCGVEALFLDRDRNPIKGLHFRMEQCGKTRDGTTGENGKSKQLFTETPDDTVKIWVKRLDGGWKLVTTVVSGFGNKLVTLVSAHMVIEARTEKHPDLPPGAMPDPREKPKPTHGPGKAPPPTTDKKALGLKATSTKTPDGKALTVVEGDIPGLDFLGGYTGEKITEADYDAAAKELGCEVEVIKAIAKQETGKLEALGLGAFDKSNRPTILYERHIFSGVTKGVHDAKHPDLSSSKEYLAGTAKNKDGVKYDDGAHYGLFSWQYKKLAKASQLDKDAAIQACSWGKFQVLGKNYKLCGFPSAISFAKAMCKSEKEHLNVMVSFCKGNKLETALKNKNWAAIAKTYNGPRYKRNKYDTELEAHYGLFKAAKK